MKSISKLAVLFIAFNTWTMISPQKATAQISVNFQAFYDDLSPYGSWVLNPNYGYVWIPNVSMGFIPYATNGHWLFTNVGWTWVSNYPWGWAPFHYGRWYYDYNYGWIWVPDYEWGPAWVVWRRCEGYYGWAPIGPGISISVAYGGSYNLPSNQWILVRYQDLGRTNINNYYIRTSDNSRILKNSTVIKNTRTDNRVKYGTGPNRNEIEKRTGSTLKTVAIRERNKPGQNMNNGELYVYKPKVEKHTASGLKPVPNKVVKMKDIKPNSKTNTSQQSAHRQEQSVSSPQNKSKEQQVQKQSQRHEQTVPQPNKQYRVQYPQEQQHRNEQPVHQQPQKQNHPQQQSQHYEQSAPQQQQQKHSQKQH